MQAGELRQVFHTHCLTFQMIARVLDMSITCVLDKYNLCVGYEYYLCVG